MPDQHTLAETERATARQIDRLPVNMVAAHAVSSLYRAANAARAHLTKTVLAPHDLSWTGFLVLWVLWIWGRRTTSDTADAVGVSKATLTGVVGTLISRGLVERQNSEHDRRLVELKLTDQGKRLLDTLYPEFNQVEAQIVEGLSADDVEVMTRVLRQIVVQFEE